MNDKQTTALGVGIVVLVAMGASALIEGGKHRDHATRLTCFQEEPR